MCDADLGWAAATASGASDKGTVGRLGDDQARTGRPPCDGLGATAWVSPGTGKAENGRPRPIPRDGVLWWSTNGGDGAEERACLEPKSDAGDLGDVWAVVFVLLEGSVSVEADSSVIARFRRYTVLEGVLLEVS